MFNPSRLSYARRRAGLTKAGLAKIAGINERLIKYYEAGAKEPLPETVEKLAAALQRAAAFFYAASDIEVPHVESASFRSLSTMTAGQRESALAAGGLAIHVGNWIDKEFVLPKPDLPDLEGIEPEAAASILRREWGLGQKAAPNMVHLLESRGVRVFALPVQSRNVSAFSFWYGDVPIVLLNTADSGERGRMDLAHELGHLVLHKTGSLLKRSCENEANQFASAFLMPAASVTAVARRSPTLPVLVEMKKMWSVSVFALIVRLNALRLLSDWEYRSLCIDATANGYRSSEPAGIRRETSQILSKVLKAIREAGETKVDLARTLEVAVDELNGMFFGLTLTAVQGGGLGEGRPDSPGLRLV
jgi:Zn-dependent peptidase ImmA (M78 family)/DNA-binding XRE family transcriptional regulator